ncbi:hypothetical protein E2C01_065997 [Portunus trituberculatus]|uniref:Uncharacterized protein n=1 Tax=Portunus trituberculatus TaxID=210409 RepID=A0A5B7HG16_PORTR|nr:hypothetical protein [Portunus trituberculatus]
MLVLALYGLSLPEEDKQISQAARDDSVGDDPRDEWRGTVVDPPTGQLSSKFEVADVEPTSVFPYKD